MFGKTWEIFGKYLGKAREIFGKTWEIVGKSPGNSWEKPGKYLENGDLGKYGKHGKP
ncbi:MAG: hypothetical protein ILO53_04215 [Clostridia bacterium]|nr:hypothetical protein [Clostridia bacterium]